MTLFSATCLRPSSLGLLSTFRTVGPACRCVLATPTYYGVTAEDIMSPGQLARWVAEHEVRPAGQCALPPNPLTIAPRCQSPT